MPDSSNNVNSGVRASAVDWSRPIEAVHEDGTVVPMIFERFDGSCAITTDDPRKDSNQYWEMDGTDCVSRSRWRIRNVQPTTPERDPALWDRMVTLVRDMASTPNHLKGSWTRTAAEIVAELDPVDPDLLEARRIADEHTNNGKPGKYIAGERDDEPGLKAVLAAIKRGRELAAPEVSHAG